MKKKRGRIIFLVGADGSGKSYFSSWLHTYLLEKQYSSVIVWSRFNNYFSKPLLGMLRFTGHNYYKEYKGVLFGFHDFENLFFFRSIFIFLQMIDVNISSYYNIISLTKKKDIIVCERGPFDTLVDVLVDVNFKDTIFKKCFLFSLKTRFDVYFIDRDIDKIISSRNELAYDFKLQRKIDMYRSMSKIFNWTVINNNGDVENTKKQIVSNIAI